jgi:hypothetical protein
MSTFLGMNNGDPLLHMTSDTKTQTELKGDPLSTTIFHSDLPYVFVREQFELTSYTNYNGTNGGRKFAISSELKTFRQNNPDLAYLLVMEDSSGSTWVHEPLTCVAGGTYDFSGELPNNFDFTLAVNGSRYQTVYHSTDAEVDAITQNDNGPNFTWTFRTWDPSEDYITVFRNNLDERTIHTHGMFPGATTNPAQPLYSERMFCYRWIGPAFANTKLESSGNLDIVKLRFVFLNVTHSGTAFERQKGFSVDRITLNPTNFTVNSVDLAKMTPLISRGVQSDGATVSPLTANGIVAAAKKEGINLDTAKITSAGAVSGGPAPVVEIPEEVSTLTGWDFNLKDKTIARNGSEIFNTASASRSLFVSGAAEVTFEPDISVSSNTDVEVTSTVTGNLGLVDSDTIYLASFLTEGNKLHSTSIFGPGDNLLMYLTIGFRKVDNSMPQGFRQWCSDFMFYLRITSSGNLSIRMEHTKGSYSPFFNLEKTTWQGIASVSFDLPEFKVRLIALKSA